MFVFFDTNYAVFIFSKISRMSLFKNSGPGGTTAPSGQRADGELRLPRRPAASAAGSGPAVPAGSAGRTRSRSVPVRVVLPAAEPQVAPRGPAPSPGRSARGGAGRGRSRGRGSPSCGAAEGSGRGGEQVSGIGNGRQREFGAAVHSRVPRPFRGARRARPPPRTWAEAAARAPPAGGAVGGCGASRPCGATAAPWVWRTAAPTGPAFWRVNAWPGAAFPPQRVLNYVKPPGRTPGRVAREPNGARPKSLPRERVGAAVRSRALTSRRWAAWALRVLGWRTRAACGWLACSGGLLSGAGELRGCDNRVCMAGAARGAFSLSTACGQLNRSGHKIAVVVETIMGT